MMEAVMKVCSVASKLSRNFPSFADLLGFK
jgi:hypothetical protein